MIRQLYLSKHSEEKILTYNNFLIQIGKNIFFHTPNHHTTMESTTESFILL